jgi:hypothetical protein
MGWLFAVGLGFQERDRRAVWRALGPMALGHALAIAVAVLAAALVGLVLPQQAIKGLVSGLLFGLGVYHLVRHAHPRRGGMRVGRRDLVIWSFFVASAHGAGLMALPFVLDGGGVLEAHAAHGAHAAVAAEAGGAAVHAGHVLSAGLPAGRWAGLLGTVAHTAGYLLATGLIAVLVYEKLGLAMLRKVWINFNAIWAGALVLTGVLTALL